MLDNCFLRSSSLAFSTLLALVPLSTFVLSLFTGFGAFEGMQQQLQQFLIEFLVPTRTEEVMRYVEYFIENSRALGVAGLLFFAVTSVVLLNGITLNINAIWGSSSRYGLVGKFFMYLSGIVLAALFLSTSFTLTHTVRSFIMDYPELSFFIKWTVQLAPSLFIFFTIWLLVFVIPSAKVAFPSSLVGALAGTVFWEAARFIFIDGTNYMIRISVIYGSIAAIPIFLIWLAIDWFIIFLAAEITYVHQHRNFWWREQHGRQMLPYQLLLLGLRIYLYIARTFLSGQQPPTIKKLAHRFSITTSAVEFFTSEFEKSGLLFKSHNSNPHILPQKDLSQISIAELLTVLIGTPQEQVMESESRQARHIIAQALKSGKKPFEDLSVMDLLHAEQDQNIK